MAATVRWSRLTADNGGEPRIEQPSAIRLHLLGSVWIERPGRLPLHVPRGPAELLGFVALAGPGGALVSRDSVAFVLWPDRPEDRARRALASTLYRLRQLLPDSERWLVAERETLALREVWVDSAAFAALAESPAPADWQRALELYGGDLLPIVGDEWADLPRTILRDRSVALLVFAIPDAATEAVLQVGPLDEPDQQATLRIELP